ncbi:hypothetical protein, partial [Burkholderia vietnamiensis]|uniref:hypothetical protein n=1 Tax=Burkholderia vietnamiensis TaxID=60552 RepID=UPI001CF58A2F
MSYATPILPSGPLGHVPEMTGHVAEIAGHDPETAGHVRPKYAACFGSRKTYPTLYSARHQFAADAKSSGWTQAEVAALLGHASDDTAARHYARARSGQSAIRVAPVGQEIQTVRAKARPYTARRRNTPNV